MTVRKTRKPRTKVKKSTRDQYLKRKYNISEEEFLRQLKIQNGKCAICKQEPPPGKNLHLDHDHKIERMKILSRKIPENGKWVSWPIDREGRLDFEFEDRNKQESRRLVKQRLLKLSARGLLCWQDNTAIQKFRDDPVRMQAASTYLRIYYQYLDGYEKEHF